MWEASKRTSVLNAMFREDTVTPIRHAANDLNAACSVWWCWVWLFNGVTHREVKALPKLFANHVPLLTVRMF